MEENKQVEVANAETPEVKVEAKKSFDDVMADKEYQAEFDRRVTKAITTAKAKWESENSGHDQGTKELENRIKELEEMNRAIVIDSLIKAEALASGVKKEKLSYVRKCVDEDFYDDQGNVDTGKVSATVQKVLKDFPELKGSYMTGMEHGSVTPPMSDVERRFYELNPDLKGKGDK